MKKILSLLLGLSPLLAFNQVSWKQDYSSSKVFIENKGQFDANENKLIGEIKYAADFGSTRVFFGKKGVSYSFLNAKKVPRDEREHLSAKLKLKTTEITVFLCFQHGKTKICTRGIFVNLSKYL
jgi:hypothetical protein